MKTLNFYPLLSLCIALLAATSPLTAQIEAGTSVQISIMGVPAEEVGKISAMYFVSESGTINMPFIGTIRAAGLKPENLASSIQSAYRSAEIYTSPTIQVVSTAEGGTVRNQVVHIGGQVGGPGPKPYNKNLTLYQAIQAAGGANAFGSLKRVKIYRDGKTTTYDVTKAENMRVPVKPDDTIEVPQKNWIGQ